MKFRFYLSLLIGFIFVITGFVFIEPLVYALGSTSTIYPYAKIYAMYIIAGSPFFMASLVMNNVLRYEGKALYSMIGLASGSILNIILDPILIFGFDMGMHGAGLSTAFSQVVSFVILLVLYLKYAQSKLKIKNIAKELNTYWVIFKTGLPSLIRQGLNSISSGLLNNIAKPYGDECISALSIVSRINMFLLSIGLGMGQGYQPVVGYNYSSKHFDRVKKAFLFTFISCTIVMSVMGIIFFIFSNNVIKLFMDPKESDVEKVIEIGGQALRYQCLAMPLLGVNLICNMSFQATRKKTLASILSVCRQGFFFIPLVLILPSIISLKGVQLTQPLSDVLSCLFSIPFFIYFIRHLNKKESENL